MSPASRSKTKDKRAAAGKEPQKPSTRPSANTSTGGGAPASGYNPLLGTFHTLEAASASSVPPINVNGRFRNIDDTDDHNVTSIGVGAEYDSVSNNDSWSGESEDHKEKITQMPSRQETTLGAENDKREKIRQKNEKKHQRQKERRAQELHERCSGYLMSRKLEALAQQLVAMGFSLERATMALILNEGRVEESVAWLFEGSEESDNQREQNLENGGNNLKIDISEELARITEMEAKFKCSKQEIERAIVACEGDLEKAIETLRTQKQDHPVPPKPEETGKPALAINENSINAQSKSTSSMASIPTQPKRENRDFTQARNAVSVAPPLTGPGSKNIQLLKKIPPKLDWGKSNTSVSYSLASTLQASPLPSKTKTQNANVGNELKNLQLGSVKEPVIVMQRPQLNQMPTTTKSSSPLTSTFANWLPSGNTESVKNMNPSGFSQIPTSTRSFSPSSYGGTINNSHMYDQFHYHLQQQQEGQYVLSGGQSDHLSQEVAGNHGVNGGLWARMGGPTTTPLAAASSLGLFTGSGSNNVDWKAGDSMLQLDYTNIDWSLDRAPPPTPWTNGMWQGSSSGPNTVMRSNNGVSNGGIGMRSDVETSAAGSWEWSSPFEEKDIFSLPRQYVSSPSL